MLEELEIFQGVDVPLDCCLVDIILLQLSKYDLCRLAISISNRKKERGKKKTKTKPSQICKKYLGIDLASAFTLLTAAEEKTQQQNLRKASMHCYCYAAAQIFNDCIVFQKTRPRRRPRSRASNDIAVTPQ
jgi:hypothetical protein